MNKLIAIFAMIPALAGAEMWTNTITGAVAPQPTYRPANAVGAPAGYFMEPGWKMFDLAQQADHDAAAAAAQAEAEAQASLPQTFQTGIAVQDEAGHWVELMPTGDGLPVIGAQVSNSPRTPEQRAAMKAERKSAHDALKAKAKAATKDKDKIDALMQAVFGIKE